MKIVIFADTGLCGTGATYFYEVPDTLSNDYIEELCWEVAKRHAEMYGIYPRCEYEDDESITEEELDSDTYSDAIEGSYTLYVPEKHDSLSVSGTPVFNEY